MSYPIRTGDPADFQAIADLDGLCFGHTYSPEDVAEARSSLDMDRFLVATDADLIVGTTADFRFHVTVPGGVAVPVPGVTWVSVAPTHRRQGILTALMDRQLRQYLADGDALAVLTASEGGIYGRFGYGPATQVRKAKIERRRARLTHAVEPGTARLVEVDEARELLPPLHQRWCAQTPGAVSRDDRWWARFFIDREARRGGMTKRGYLVHPDGYVTFCARTGERDRALVVFDPTVLSASARAALWSVLLAFDLHTDIEVNSLALDDPLPFLLTDPRRVQTTGLADGLWVRLLDVERCLSQRRYAVDVDAVIEVSDPLVGDARYRLRGGPDGGECVRTDAIPDLRCGVAALGSAYLGGHRLNQLAAAELVQADDPARLARLDLAFQAERAPVHGTGF